MPEFGPVLSKGAFPEIRDALTRKETYFFLLGFVLIEIFAYRWPTVWAFLMLCLPASLFSWATFSSGLIHKPPMTKVVILVIAFHCLLFSGALYLWSKNPKRINGDFSLLFMAIEVAVILLVLRLYGPKGTYKAAQSAEGRKDLA